MIAFLLLLLSVALADSPRLIVYLDDRDDRALEDVWVSVLHTDGTSATVHAIDDATDPQDKFAGDGMWLARLDLDRTGPAWVVVTEESPSERTAIVASRSVTIREDLQRMVFRELSPPAPVEEGGASILGLDAEALKAAGLPLSTDAIARVDTPEFDLWARVRIMWLSTGAVLVLMALAFAGIRAQVLEGLLGRSSGRTATGSAAAPARWPSVLGVAAVVAMVLAVWLPSLPKLAHHFLGIEYVDHYGTQWFYWFVEYTLREHINPAHTDLFFHPWGKDIYAHTGANVLDAYLALPFRWLLGPVLGYNLFVLFGWALSGFAFYLLAKEVCEDKLAAALAAVFYSHQPYILLEIAEGRPTQGITLFPVLFFWFTWRSATHKGWKNPVAAGIMMAISGYQYWFYALFGGIAAFAHGLARTIWPPGDKSDRWWILWRHGLIALVALILVAPSAAPMVIATSTGDDIPGLLDTNLWSVFGAPPITREDLRIGIFSWQPLRRALGFLVIDDDDNERFLAQDLAFPWVLLPILFAWYRRPGRMTRGVTLATLISLTIISIGPTLLVGNLGLPNLVYIYLIKAVSFLKRLWWPSRCILYIAMVTSMVMAVVMARIRTMGPRLQAAGLLAITAWWAADLRDIQVLPFATWDAAVPQGYRCLAQSKDRGALIELPYAWTQAHLYYQTVHERPLLGGMLEDNETFTPREFTDFRTNSPMVSRLLYGDPIGVPLIWDDKAPKEVKDLGYRYVVVQKDAFYNAEDPDGSGRLVVLMGELERSLGAAVYNDGRLAIYAPWGDPAPCDVANWKKDPAPMGPTEAMQDIREYDRARQVFTRWPVKPEEEAETEEETEDGAAAAQ